MTKTRFKNYINTRKEKRRIARLLGITIAASVIAISAICATAVDGGNPTMQHGVVILNGTKILLDNNTAISYDAKGYNDNDEIIIIRDGKDARIISNKFYVSKGDTIWDIAKDLCPSTINIQKFVDAIYQVNDIDNIYPGMELIIPVMK